MEDALQYQSNETPENEGSLIRRPWGLDIAAWPRILGENSRRIRRFFLPPFYPLKEDLWAALERITDGFFVIDENWRILYVNQEAERMAGYSRKDILGKDLWEVAPQSIGSTYYHKYHEAMKSKQPLSFVEFYPPRSAWFETHVYPSNAGLSIYFRDVTERVEREKNREKLLSTLKEATEKLEKSNLELEQFAAVAAHDLKEPVRMVKTYLDLLQRKTQSTSQDQSSTFEILGIVSKAAERLSTLVNSLSELQSLDPEFKTVSCSEIFESARAILKDQIEDSGAEITTSHFPERIRCMPNALVRVFQNLISNSIKFRAASPPQIHFDCHRDGKNWVFTASDNGAGFDAKDSEIIFTSFKRLPYHADRAGSGLGLWICEKIIDKHGGRIWADGDLGKGARFFFSLPIADEGV